MSLQMILVEVAPPIASLTTAHPQLLDAHDVPLDTLPQEVHALVVLPALLFAPAAHPPLHAPHVTPTTISHPPLVHVSLVQLTVLQPIALPPPIQDVSSVTQDSILVAPILAHHVMLSV
jgi:hypothetical protein